MRRGMILKVWYKYTYIIMQTLTGYIVMYPRRVALDDGVGVDAPPSCAGNEGDLVRAAAAMTGHDTLQDKRPGNEAYNHDM